MAFYKQDIVDINLNTGNIFRSFLGHSIGFKNDDADRFGIRAFRDGEPVDLTGASCQAVFINPLGTNIALTSYGTVSGNVAYVTLPQACYDYEGQFCLSIQLVGGGVTGTMRIIDGMVVNTGASGTVAPTASVPTYQEILSTYDAMVAATSAANLAIAETFDATKAYPAGKYVINSGALYRLTADHAANVTWANTSKVATNLGDETNSLKSALNFTEKQLEITYLLYNRGAILLNGNDIDDGSYLRTAYIPVKSGEKIKYTLRSATNYAIVAFYNSSMELSAYIAGTNARADGEYTFASDGYVRFCCYNASLSYAYISFENSQIYKLNAELDKHLGVILNNTNIGKWEQGTYYASDGADYDNSSLDIRNSTKVGVVNGVERIICKSGYKVLPFAYDENDDFLGCYKTNGQFEKTTSNLNFVTEFDLFNFKNYTFKFAAENNAHTTIIPSDGENILYLMTTDRTLTTQGKSADAKETGDRIVSVNSSRDLFDIVTIKGAINTSGVNVADNSYYRSDFIPVKAGTTYKYAIRAASNYSIISMYGKDKLPLTAYNVAGTNGMVSGEFVVPQDGYIRLCCYGIRVTDKTAYFTLKDDRVLYLINKATEHDSNISEIKSILRTVPDYYTSHIQSKTSQIIENMNDVGMNGETAIFITDVHWDSGNTKNSPSLVNYILNHSNVNVLLCGGDIINEGTRESQLALIQSFMDEMKFADVPLPVAFGNHDSNKNAGNPEADWFDRNTVFSMLMKPASNDVTYISSYDWSFYYDKKATKTRFVFIDTGEEGVIQPNAQDSVFNTLNYVPEGYHVIIVAHWIYNMSSSALTTTGQKIASIVDAYNSKGTITIDEVNYDFTNAHGSCELIIAGHSHANIQGKTTGGVPYVLTDCDNRARSENVATRTAGTTAEQAFDVITINYADHSVKCCRIGAGSNRTFSNGSWS